MNNPVQIIEGLKTIASIAVAWTVLMGFWPLAPEQQALTITLFLAIINFGGMIWQNSLVTPLANPTAKDGEPLVRASGATRSILAPKEK